MATRTGTLLLCLACAACNQTPRFAVAGLWEARPAFSHNAYYYLNLTQSGEDIGGTACHFDSGPGTIFHDVPVTGVYPNVQFSATVPGADGPRVARFAGHVTDSGNLFGTLSYDAAASGTDLRFTHVDYALPAACAPSSK